MNGQLPLILRHRPASFAAVRGHEATIAALQRRIVQPGHPHAFLLTGPSGTGKTTLARLIAYHFGAEVTEVDGASHNGVDAMRALVEFSRYRPGDAYRIIIIDECHRLSKNAWDAALKSIEEPPSHLYWGLATTEFDAVPDTIVTRCYHIRLERLPDLEIEKYLFDILLAEGWDRICDPEVFRLVVFEAQGSPRLALTLLDACYDAPNVTEAERIVALHGSSDPMIQVVQLLVRGQGTGWDSIRPLLAQVGDGDFSSRAMIGVQRYIIGAIDRERDERRAQRLWELLASLTYPSTGYDQKSLFYAAVGRALWSSV
jgi:DNA polymerase-3 subunit gamma/tau